MEMNPSRRRAEIDLEPLPDGKTRMTVTMPVTIVGAEIGKSADEMARTGLLVATVTPAQR